MNEKDSYISKIDEARLKAIISEVTKSVIAEMTAGCPMGLTKEELSAMKEMSACYKQGKAACIKFMVSIMLASIVGGLTFFVVKFGAGSIVK